MTLKNLTISLLGVLAVFQSANLYAAEVSKGRGIYQSRCLPCHGPSGEGLIGPAIGCHGVKNKSDEFLYETIYYGRKGEHGTDMPSWGKGDPFKISKEAEDFKKTLSDSKRYSSHEVEVFTKKVYGEAYEFPAVERKGAEVVKQLGYLDSDDIRSVVKFLRNMEEEQEKNAPSECIADKRSRFNGNVDKGKTIFIEICSKCHGSDAKGDQFFIDKDLSPRDFTDKVYMDSKTDQYLKLVIKKGGLQQGRSAIMAPITLDDTAMEDVITYIRTLSK